MKERKSYEFKAATVDEAIANGLKELGLSLSQVDIEKKSYGGIFTKACVVITPKEEPAAPVVKDSEDEADWADEGQDDVVQKILPSAALTEIAESCASFVRELVSLMGVHCDVTYDTENAEINIYINGEDAGQIIGYRGEVLDAIQYFALMLANKSGEKEFIRVQLDAGNYRKKRKETLALLARRLAAKTARSGRRTVLEPMNPFERRVIHTTLANDKEVTTQSEGEGKYRHVVIIPVAEEKYNNTISGYGRSNDFRRNGPGRTRSFGSFGDNKRKF
jgi:spoIIIJ-associated protein